MNAKQLHGLDHSLWLHNITQGLLISDSVSGYLHEFIIPELTSTTDPAAQDVLYVEALVAPDTINMMPDKTLLAFADHGRVQKVPRLNGGDAEAVLTEFASAGINDEALVRDLQRKGTATFAKSWHDLENQISSKITTPTKVVSA